MQERSRLENAFENIAKLTTDLADNLELAELGEMDDDEDLVEAAAQALLKVKETSGKAELEALLSGEADGNLLKSIPARAAQRRRIGRKWCCACTHAGPMRTA